MREKTGTGLQVWLRISGWRLPPVTFLFQPCSGGGGVFESGGVVGLAEEW